MEPNDHEKKGWTRVGDDTGGGHSMTHFDTLYIEGSSLEAGILLYQLFEQPPNCSTREYGAVFSFKPFPSFELASAYDRGCEWVRGEPYPRPDEPSTQSWRKYVPTDVWRARCVCDLPQAIQHSRDYDASRNVSFIATRPDVLAACLPEWDDGVGRDHPPPGRDAAAFEFLALARRDGELWTNEGNLDSRSGALATVVALGLRSLLDDDGGYWKNSWSSLGRALESRDIALALRLRHQARKPDAEFLEEANVAEALALAWEAREAPHGAKVLDLARAMPAQDVESASRLCQTLAGESTTPRKLMPSLRELASWLESLLITQAANCPQNEAPRPRL